LGQICGIFWGTFTNMNHVAEHTSGTGAAVAPWQKSNSGSCRLFKGHSRSSTKQQCHPSL